ncbi:MAG: TonB-dependent receptor [Bacteroides sp.]|nr:TonB-dependent receptor [Bacteroides sp.]
MACTCLNLHAQELGDTITGKVHAIPEVGVKWRRVSPALTSTAPLQQMKKAEMERLGVLDVADAVRHFSGVSVKDYGGIGGLKTVSVRSLGAQHTAVSYDGVTVSNCQSGQVDVSRFSLDNVSELTLSIGQSDNIYQTARMFASAGVLSIETAKPDFNERPFRLIANMNAGSYGLANPSLFYAQKLNRIFSLTGYANYLRADGNYPFKLKNDTKWIDAKRNNSDIEAYRAEVNLFVTLNGKQDLKVKAYLFNSERGLPGGVIYDNAYAAERLYDRNYFGQVKYENRFSEKWKLQASGKFNYTWNRDYNKESSGITDDRFRQTETYLSATLWAEPVKGLSFSLAQDFAYNYLSTTLENNQSPERYTYLAVAAARYDNNHFSATASLLNTFITENVRTGDAADDRKHLSPAVSLSWKPFDFRLRFRASYKDIFRVPTFNDLYYLRIGNYKLKPETTRQVNLGTTWSSASLGLIDYLSLSVDAYYNKVEDKIVAMPTMFIWKMANLGKVETIGTDVNLAAEVELGKHYKVYLMGTYNYVQAEDITDRNSKLWRNQIIYTPKHSGSGSLTLENPYVNITYNLLYASERYSIAQNIPANRIKPYTDHGISLSRTFKWKKQSLRVQVDALNLSDKNYEIVRYYPMPGRNYKITINYYL